MTWDGEYRKNGLRWGLDSILLFHCSTNLNSKIFFFWRFQPQSPSEEPRETRTSWSLKYLKYPQGGMSGANPRNFITELGQKM